MTVWYSSDCVDLALREHDRRWAAGHTNVQITRIGNEIRVSSLPPQREIPEFWINRPYEPQPGEFEACGVSPY